MLLDLMLYLAFTLLSTYTMLSNTYFNLRSFTINFCVINKHISIGKLPKSGNFSNLIDLGYIWHAELLFYCENE